MAQLPVKAEVTASVDAGEVGSIFAQAEVPGIVIFACLIIMVVLVLLIVWKDWQLKTLSDRMMKAAEATAVALVAMRMTIESKSRGGDQ